MLVSARESKDDKDESSMDSSETNIDWNSDHQIPELKSTYRDEPGLQCKQEQEIWIQLHLKRCVLDPGDSLSYIWVPQFHTSCRQKNLKTQRLLIYVRCTQIIRLPSISAHKPRTNINYLQLESPRSGTHQERRSQSSNVP